MHSYNNNYFLYTDVSLCLLNLLKKKSDLHVNSFAYSLATISRYATRECNKGYFDPHIVVNYKGIMSVQF